VPVVYEAAPLTLLRPQQDHVPLIKLSAPEEAGTGAGGGVPGPPDAGFFGRDETLLALDRAFDAQRVVLLHAFAGAGKSSTAAEFARWYRTTGGLDQPGHPDLGPGPVLWSSFEHHLPLDRLLDAAGDCFAGLLEANGDPWQATTSPARRRDLIMQVLAQVPVLWVWDNVEPVTGFPPGTPSPWTPAEQDELVSFLRDLAQHTRCKVLVTSRRDEQAWLGGLPARLALPPMPMRERLQLTTAIAARYGAADPGIDWRPLLRYTAGNPLTITVLAGQALREGLASTAQVEAFVDRLRAGEAELEPGEDAALGRTRSLAASLSYGFTHAFTEAERGQLAVLHLFRDTIDADALRFMGDPGITAGDDAVPQLAGLTRETTVALLDRAAGIGLLSGLGGGYYAIHPALPWYFTTLFAAAYGPPDSPPARQAARAYTHTLAWLGNYYYNQDADGAGDPVPVLRAEEANLLHALALARHAQHWDDVIMCLQGLRALYQRTGRDGEWARLVEQVTPDFIDPATDGPLPGRDEHWSFITAYRARLATAARDWPTATRLLQARITWARGQAAAALATPGSQLTPLQRNQIRSLAIALEDLGHILRFQGDPGCLPYYEEVLSLYQQISARTEEANLANTLGNAYKDIPGLRNLDQAEHWYQHSLTHRAENDTLGRAKTLASLGHLAYARFGEARDAGEAEAVLLAHLTTALDRLQQALALFPPDDAEDLAPIHGQIGNIYREAGETRQALRHYQQSIAYDEARGNIYRAGQIRYNIALLLQEAGRRADALLYARAALSDFEDVGPGAAQDAARTRDLITRLEHDSA
jgi:tetratricopeptide (TPR) repeat protein